MMKKIVILMILAIVIMAGLVVLRLYDNRPFSRDAMELKISGPNEVKMGEEIEYDVSYKNKGSFDLKGVKIIFSMPENSLTEDGQTRIEQPVGDMSVGQTGQFRVKTRVLGQQGDAKTAKAAIFFSPQNLTAKYEVNADFASIISEVPIDLSFENPQSVQRGSELDFFVKYLSHIDYPLENMSLRLDKIDGFDFKSSIPSSLDNSEWKIKTLNKSDGGTVSVAGIINDQAGQDVNLSVKLGMWVNGNFIVIKNAVAKVQVTEPPVLITPDNNQPAQPEGQQ